MIIGIDYRLAACSHRGMGRYCREIVDKLLILDNVNQYILYIDTDCPRELPPNFKWHKIPTANFILGEQLILPIMLFRDKIDVMWSPSNTFPLFAPRKMKLIVTVHDLIFMYKLPHGQNLVQRIGALYRRWVMVLGRRKVDQYVTVSDFSASELDRIFKIQNAAITYNCIESFIKKAETHTQPPGSCDYYFTLSADAPSKNLPFLLDTFSSKLLDHKLIVAGIKRNSPLRKRYNRPNIEFLENGISDDILIDYYMGCKAFIYVSLQEGFGIPPLEALACGAKIICSNATSLPDVVGGHGILIDPRNERELIEAIDAIKSFKIEQEKLNLHLKQFSDWTTPAKSVLQILEQAHQGS